jgi:hypothetical protein
VKDQRGKMQGRRDRINKTKKIENIHFTPGGGNSFGQFSDEAGNVSFS